MNNKPIDNTSSNRSIGRSIKSTAKAIFKGRSTISSTSKGKKELNRIIRPMETEIQKREVSDSAMKTSLINALKALKPLKMQDKIKNLNALITELSNDETLKDIVEDISEIKSDAKSLKQVCKLIKKT